MPRVSHECAHERSDVCTHECSDECSDVCTHECTDIRTHERALLGSNRSSVPSRISVSAVSLSTLPVFTVRDASMRFLQCDDITFTFLAALLHR